VHHAAIEILLLLLVGCTVGLVAMRLRVPYTLTLVVAGISLGFVQLEQLEAFELNAEVLFTFLLPALLFEAAFHLDIKDFNANKLPILMLAIPGVLLSVGVTAALAQGLIGGSGLRSEFGWAHAALFASVIAATDPISVLAIFKELGVTRRLYLLVEGESLVNDGVAVVVFLIVAAMFGVDVGHGGHHELHGWAETMVFGVKTFVYMGGVGVLVGVIAGSLATTVMRQFDDHLVEITITTIVAYGSFLLSEEIGASGVLATVTAGIVTGSYGTRYGMSTQTRLAVEDFWEYMAFVANTFVFLLVGLQLEITALAQDVLPISLGFLAMLVGRIIAVGGLFPLIRFGSKPIPAKWSSVLIWGGLKGSLSMVLILGVSTQFEGRELLIRLVFGVVSASLFLQGLSIGPLLKWLGLSGTKAEESIAFEAERAQVVAATHALHTLDSLLKEGLVDAQTGEKMRAWYLNRREAASQRANELVGSAHSVSGHQLLELARQLADVEREAIRHAARTDVIGKEAGGCALRELDERIFELKHVQHDPDLEEKLVKLFRPD